MTAEQTAQVKNSESVAAKKHRHKQTKQQAGFRARFSQDFNDWWRNKEDAALDSAEPSGFIIIRRPEIWAESKLGFIHWKGETLSLFPYHVHLKVADLCTSSCVMFDHKATILTLELPRQSFCLLFEINILLFE